MMIVCSSSQVEIENMAAATAEETLCDQDPSIAMDAYMERRLLGMHQAGSAAKFKEKFIVFVAAVVIIFLIPVVHLGVVYYLWGLDKPRVDEERCQCSCFDTVNRGRYEWPPSSFKHMYINSTTISGKMWLLIVLGIVALYEVIRYVGLLLWQRKLRLQFLVLLLSSIYAHYYGWWGFLNYYNEEFYYQWWHQMFFSVTEIISTALVVHMCNANNDLEPSKLLLIVDINGMHILVNCLDQFINNVIFRQGKQFEAMRDIGLLMPDVLHVLVCYFELRMIAERKKIRILRLFYKEELMMSAVLVIVFSILGKNL